MKLVLLKEKMFDEHPRFMVGENNIRALQGYFSISFKELEAVTSYASSKWEQLCQMVDIEESFRAHIRFDLVPQFTGKTQKEDNTCYLGELSIKGAYEINTHSPECMSCDALFRESFPQIAKHTPSAAKALGTELYHEYRQEKIDMVKGEAVTRDSWCSALKREMSKVGVSISEVSVEKALSNGRPVLWRWGNVDFNNEYGEFSSDFQQQLYEAQDRISIFNSIPHPQKDIANKGLLAKNGEVLLDSKENLQLALRFNKDEYVLKPLIGTSGKGIVFGDNVSAETFKKAVHEAYQKGGYGLFKKVLLPRVKLNGDIEDFTLDFLPSFFAKGSKLYYLYSVIRMEPWHSYIKRKTINVLQGGGYGGTVAVHH